MAHGEASTRADMAANTPSGYRQSDNGLSVHRTSGIVRLPNGISPAEAGEEALVLRAIRGEDRQTFIEEVDDIGGITFGEYHARLLNLLLVNRQNGGLRSQDLVDQGFLSSDNPGLPTLSESVQAEILARQSAMRLNQAFDRPIVRVEELGGQLRRIGLAPYVQFEDPEQFGSRTPEPVAEAEDGMALPQLSRQTIKLLRATAITPLIDKPADPGRRQRTESDLEDDLMNGIHQRRPKYSIELPDQPMPGDAIAAVLSSNLPIAQRQREALALIGQVEPDLFGVQTLSNGRSYTEALRIYQTNPNIAVADLLGVTGRELESVIKDTLATVRRFSTGAADLLEQAIYVSDGEQEQARY